MNKVQEIKLKLLDIFKSNADPVRMCRRAYEYLTEDEEEYSDENETLANTENGIYLVFKNGQYSLYHKGMSKSLAGDVTGIGVFYDGHTFQVALKDLGELPLIEDENNTCPEESPFYKTECEGLHDWDFVGATNHLKECGMDMPLPEGWYIPTLAVLEVMCFLKEEINAAIKFAGGKPLSEDYYWSSTENSRSSARFVNFSSGVAYNNYKYYSNVVRPVAAFDLET